MCQTPRGDPTPNEGAKTLSRTQRQLQAKAPNLFRGTPTIAQGVALSVPTCWRQRRLHSRRANSFHEKAGQSQDSFVFPICGSLLSSRAASVAILPSAVFYERFSLAARWASSIQ